MPTNLEFKHLKIPQTHSGKAKLDSKRFPSKKSQENQKNAQAHSDFILTKGQKLNDYWRRVREERMEREEPELPSEVPMLIQVDPSIDLDAVRSAFNFEVVAEYEDGYLVIANDDLDFTTLKSTMCKLVSGQRGGGNAAKIYDLIEQEDQSSRLIRILSDDLYANWGYIDDSGEYIVDIGVECLGKIKLPSFTPKRENESDESFFHREQDHTEKQMAVYMEWDDLKSKRESLLSDFVTSYKGTICCIVDSKTIGDDFPISDSFTMRIKISGKGLKDLALNYSFIFEIITPDDISLPISGIMGPTGEITSEFLSPVDGSPTVCIIDSGIQQNHPIIINAVLQNQSQCFIPEQVTSFSDNVNPNGHGTRVAGAVLFPKEIPKSGSHFLKCFIQNAKVLDGHNGLPTSIFPPKMISQVVGKYNSIEFGATKIYNHSISSKRPCFVKHMSAWAASIDLISYEKDVLFIQSTGNLPKDSADPIQKGILQHIQDGENYPNYLLKKSSRIANPAQSLSALTVGSIANNWSDGTKNSFSNKSSAPSAFTRTGLGIWGDIKPEVVEFGGDFARDTGNPPTLSTPSEICPELVRAQNSIGPHFSKDEVGTSFAAPKVASMAIDLQKAFPAEPAVFYKALIVQSARWPEWAFADQNIQNWEQYIRYFGFGIPSLERAISNNEHRISLHTSGEIKIKSGDVHVFHVPIPPEIASQANEQRILVEATLVYSAKPRRTRRKPRGYLGIWLDWVTSQKNEKRSVFLGRVAKEFQKEEDENTAIPWVLGMKVNEGEISGTKRNLGTTQKDWAIVNAHELPSSFCIAVRGHTGWDTHSDAYAKYALVVSFESLDNNIQIYQPIRIEVENLQISVETVEI